jgi:phosphoglycolate phosphatase
VDIHDKAMSGYKLAMFDFDGTLADSFPFFVSVFNQLAQEYRFKTVDGDEKEYLRSLPARQIMRHVGMPSWKLPLVAQRFISLMNQQKQDVLPFAGMDEVLRYLHSRKITLAVVSSNSYENVCRVMGPETSKLFRYFECGASIFGKASRITKVLKQSGTPCEQALYIGDQGEDALAARKAKVAFGAVSWGYATIASLQAYQPQYVFSSVADIKEVIGPPYFEDGECRRRARI